MTDYTISEVARVIGVSKSTIQKYICRVEFAHILKKRTNKELLLCNVLPADFKRLQNLAARTHRKMDSEELNQYNKVIQQNHCLQSELRHKNLALFNIAKVYEPELATMAEIIKKYGDDDAK